MEASVRRDRAWVVDQGEGDGDAPNPGVSLSLASPWALSRILNGEGLGDPGYMRSLSALDALDVLFDGDTLHLKVPVVNLGMSPTGTAQLNVAIWAAAAGRRYVGTYHDPRLHAVPGAPSYSDTAQAHIDCDVSLLAVAWSPMLRTEDIGSLEVTHVHAIVIDVPFDAGGSELSEFWKRSQNGEAPLIHPQRSDQHAACWTPVGSGPAFTYDEASHTLTHHVEGAVELALHWRKETASWRSALRPAGASHPWIPNLHRPPLRRVLGARWLPKGRVDLELHVAAEGVTVGIGDRQHVDIRLLDKGHIAAIRWSDGADGDTDHETWLIHR